MSEHLLIPRNKLYLPPRRIEPHPAIPADILELAGLEREHWSEDLDKASGLQAASFVSNIGAAQMLEGLTNFFRVRLYIGNPGTKGLVNEAAENKLKEFTMSGAGFEGRKRTNTSAPEWVEVKANETWKFFGIFTKEAVEFAGYGEFAAPVPVVIGDTARFPIGSLVWEIP